MKVILNVEAKMLSCDLSSRQDPFSFVSV